MESIKILYIDDESFAFGALVNALEFYFGTKSKEPEDIDNGATRVEIGKNELYCVINSKKALTLIQNQCFDLAFIDYSLINEDGGTVGIEISKKHLVLYGKKLHQVMLTAHKDKQRKALQSGVFFDYLTKPLDKNELQETLERFYSFYEELNQTRNQLYKAETESHEKSLALAELQKDFNIDISKYDGKESKNLKGKSDKMKQIRWFIDLYANVDLPILILGETGTGKELVAKEIHDKSKRKHKPYEIRNCAAIPETLIESELFGAVKGAATGVGELKGAFLLANEGTLFLDEFGDMSPNVQVKVLRAIETGTFRPLGAPKDTKVDVRVICATSKDLINDIEENKFRKDLFYRVRSLFPKMPSLKERMEDIKDIYIYLCSTKQWDYPFTNEAIQALVENEYGWEGNIRELIKFFEHTVAIFPNSKFDKDKTLKLLKLWQEHKPVSGLETEAFIENVKTTPKISKKRDTRINLNLKAYQNAIKVIEMLNNACKQVDKAEKDRSIAFARLNEADLSEDYKKGIQKAIDDGVFDNRVIGLFCTAKKGKKGMKFEAVYDYFSLEVLNLLDSNDTIVKEKLGDIEPLVRRLGDTLDNQKRKKSK